MNGPSDFYGDMSLEDVDEFEGLQPDDERPINPGGRFDKAEFRNFEQDFDWELEQSIWGQEEEEEGVEVEEPEVMLSENVREVE